MQRSFLFLQGPCTPFFTKLATKLRTEGHKVYRINFCAGDALFWNEVDAWSFRGKEDSFADFLAEKCKNFWITDQILFGDQRPMHKLAVEYAKSTGIRNHVFEEGYFRPDWITLEREGVNSNSLLPKEPDWFMKVGSRFDNKYDFIKVHSNFHFRAFYDIVYHIAGLLNPILYPYYKTHAPMSAPIEYTGYIKRFARLRIMKTKEQEMIKNILTSDTPYFILPLQLNSDAQIRDHSQFENMQDVLQYVLKSFASNASENYHLVVKNHPLDMGLMPYAKMIRKLEKDYKLEGRVHFLESGDLVALSKKSLGMVTVNSTSGLVALENEIPVLTLSDPIYNVSGLTSQENLDRFWSEPMLPNMELFDNFKSIVLNTLEVNGSFYCTKGIKTAVENASRIVVCENSPLERLQ